MNVVHDGSLPITQAARVALAEAPPSSPLRIAMVVEAAGGGVAVHLADLIAGLRDRAAAEIHLIAPIGDRFDRSILSDALAHCTSFHPLDFRREVGPHDIRAARELRRLLHRLQPDVVHSHSSKAGALARLCRGPWKQVYTPHAVYTLNPTLSGLKRRFYGSIERLLGNHCSDAIIAVSAEEATHLSELGIARRRIRTVVNGVTPPDLLSRDAARHALNVSKHAFVVGFVGRFDFQKGVDRLVRMARQLFLRYGEQLQIVAIGSGDFGRAAGSEALDVPPNLRVAGRLEGARRYFSAFDLFVLPSRYEGFPYVCLEALAARVPIVATHVAGVAELVDDHHVGLTVANHDDVDAFVAAVAKLVDDNALLAQMSKHCFTAFDHFSAKTMVDRTLAIYRELASEQTS